MVDASVEGSFTGKTRASRAVRNISMRMRKNRPSGDSTFSPSDILPQDGHQPYPKRPESDLRPSYEDNPELVFGAPRNESMSAGRSASPPSVFDAPDDQQEHETEPTTRGSLEEESYDLKPPPPMKNHENIESLATRFFSSDHLDLIIRDQNAGPRFIQFLEQYRPQYSSTLNQYIQVRKALTAVDYANAVAESIPGSSSHFAANIDNSFDSRAKQIADDLIQEALPAYLTHRLTNVVTDTLVKTITGNNIPAMQELIPNLAEVYCITDPSLADNPIVYASDEFYNTTQYGRDYVIGRNCRFLQGPRTSEATVRRMAMAQSEGEEICETILNYRRDGTPFMNLLLLAPMYDNKGEVKYYLGAQIDVSPLIEAGRGLDTFAQLLAEDRKSARFVDGVGKGPVELLSELGQMLDEHETEEVFRKVKGGKSRSQVSSGTSTPVRQSQQPQRQGSQRRPNGRRILSMDDEAPQRTLWPDASLGRSGRLPGVYRNVESTLSRHPRFEEAFANAWQYLLVRPYPSLRITFTSPTLRIPGLLQTKLMDRIGGPEHLRTGILEAFRNGNGVTAKVPWTTNGKNAADGRPRWIHCTPMLGSDERVGVWMVVLVENEEVTGLLNRGDSVKSASTRGGPIDLGPVEKEGSLYADYMRSSREEGRPETSGGLSSASARERREVDGHFKDF